MTIDELIETIWERCQTDWSDTYEIYEATSKYFGQEPEPKEKIDAILEELEEWE